MAFDVARGVTVLFGGRDWTGDVTDTWEWDGTSWLQVASTGPTPREDHVMAYDSARQRTVLYGGKPLAMPFLDDTWEWDGAAWMQVAPTGPGAAEGMAMVFDERLERTFLFGGLYFDTDGAGAGEAWEWDGQTWTGKTSGPLMRSGVTMAYDSARDRIVLFGGNDGADIFARGTYEWDGANWISSDYLEPPARSGSAIVYDRERGVTLLFGGASRHTAFADTWEYTGASP